MARHEFVETEEKGVHLVIDGEFTLCGDAFDLATDEGPSVEWVARRHGPVSCADCAAIILGCRGVRVKVTA